MKKYGHVRNWEGITSGVLVMGSSSSFERTVHHTIHLIIIIIIIIIGYNTLIVEVLGVVLRARL